MDSLSQIVLGASVAAIAAPAGQRRRALLIGAALGTLPDLDVLIRYGDPVSDFTKHRGFSHSLFVLPVVALALWGAWMALSRLPREAPWRWLLAFELALVTHPLLDAFTVYGTQLAWPLEPPPVMIGSVFIIDPLYTVWLLVGCIAAWRLREKPRAGFWLGTGLVLSTAYLGWTVFAQGFLTRAIEGDHQVRGVVGARFLVQPTPFNSLAWRIVVQHPDGHYYQGWYSFIAPASASTLERHPLGRELLEPLVDQPVVQRLQWFTSGWMAAREIDGRIVVEDLRMGQAGQYIFRFVVGERRDGRIVPVPPEQLPWPSRGSADDWRQLWRILRTGN
jgi:inner membrane protein